MNDIKNRHPFVDLLKPEVGAVLPVLYALDVDIKPKLLKIAGVAQKLGWDWMRHLTGFLGEDEADSESSSAISNPQPDSINFDLSQLREMRKLTREEADRLLVEAHGLAS